MDLRLLQTETAALIGVSDAGLSEATVYAWEHGEWKPSVWQRPGLIVFLG